MTNVEDELLDLKKQNNDLAQQLQYWQMRAAENESEKLNLVKENNDLRLKLSFLRNTGFKETRKVNDAIQSASGNAVACLVRATEEIARTMEIAKAYVRDREELEAQLPRWSTLSNTSTPMKKEKVHRVPPMVGGQSIQPVVALNRIRSTRSQRQSSNRAVPLHMLPDVYIPLTRIDDHINIDMESGSGVVNLDDITEGLDLEDADETSEEQEPSTEVEDFRNRTLPVLEEEEEETETIATPRLTLHIDDPLEGPSWLLDTPSDSRVNGPKVRVDRSAGTPRQAADDDSQDSSRVSVRLSCEFSPTMRLRKRTSSPRNSSPGQQYFSPRPPARKINNTNGRVLKVLVAKMRLDSDVENGTSAPKRARSPTMDSLRSFDAPSPNGTTDSCVVVSESRPSCAFGRDIKIDSSTPKLRVNLTRDIRQHSRSDSQVKIENRINSQESHDISDRDRQTDSQITNRYIPNGQLATNDISGRSRNTDEQLNVRTGINSLDDQLNNDEHNGQVSQQSPERDRNSLQNVTHRANSQSNRRNARLISDQERESRDSHDSDSSSGAVGNSSSQSRSRRTRKIVTYTERRLNTKLRR